MSQATAVTKISRVAALAIRGVWKKYSYIFPNADCFQKHHLQLSPSSW